MMMMPRYEYVYETVFTFLGKHGIAAYPVDPLKIAALLGIRLASFVKATQNTILRMDDICAFCGNPDGAVFTLLPESPYRHMILFNSAMPEQRQHFTIAEECAHVLLGHSDDPRFLLSRQSSDELYHAYEQEARAAAGLLLCSPKLLDMCKNVLDPKIISLACNISEECAAVRIRQHKCFGMDMRSIPAYQALPAPRISSTKAKAAMFQKLQSRRIPVKNFTRL